MNKALVEQAHHIRAQAAALKAQAERLLEDLREFSDITAPPNQEEYIPKKHGRIILHVR